MQQEIQSTLEQIDAMLSEIAEIPDFNILKYEKKLELYIQIHAIEIRLLDKLIERGLLDLKDPDLQEIEKLRDKVFSFLNIPRPKLFKRYEQLVSKQRELLLRFRT